MRVFDIIAWILLVVGGINWGLVAINPTYNLVDMLFGPGTEVARIVYGAVGVAAIYAIFRKVCCCSSNGSCKM